MLTEIIGAPDNIKQGQRDAEITNPQGSKSIYS